MCAQGLLQNPAMFNGYPLTPVCCLKDWLDITLGLGTPFTSFHHHLIYMCEHIMTKSERRVFNALNSTVAVMDYLNYNYDIQPSTTTYASAV